MSGITKEEREARKRVEEIFAAKGVVTIDDEEEAHLIKLCGAMSKYWYIGHRKIRIKNGTVGEMCDQCFQGKIGRCSCPYYSRDEGCDRCWQ